MGELVILLTLVAGLHRSTETAPPAGDPAGHLRTGVQRIREAVHDGYRRSPTFKALTDDLRAASVVVYVDAGRCKPESPQPLGGCLATLAQTADARYFRMIVDVGRTDDRLVALIGHELQHAAEALSIATGDVRVAAGIYETARAQAVTTLIMNELRSLR